MEIVMRSPKPEEAGQAAEMFRKYELHTESEASSTEEVLSKTWQFPGFNLQRDARIIVNHRDEILEGKPKPISMWMPPA